MYLPFTLISGCAYLVCALVYVCVYMHVCECMCMYLYMCECMCMYMYM